MQDDLLTSRREVLAILFRWKRSMALIVLSCVGAAAFAVYYLISPNYSADAIIILSTSFLTEPLRDGPPESDFEKLANFHTQRDVIQSERIAAEAVRRTDLARTRVIGRIERIQIFIGDVKRWVGDLLGIERWRKPWNPEAAAIGAVHDWVKTYALPDSKAIKVTYRSKDPVEAAAVLNAVLDAHIEYYHDVIRNRANGVVKFLEEEFVRTRDALGDAENRLFEFKKRDRLHVGRVAKGAAPKQLPSIVGVTDSAKVQGGTYAGLDFYAMGARPGRRGGTALVIKKLFHGGSQLLR